MFAPERENSIKTRIATGRDMACGRYVGFWWMFLGCEAAAAADGFEKV